MTGAFGHERQYFENKPNLAEHLANTSNKQFWLSLVPGLSITDDPFAATRNKQFPLEESHSARNVQQVKEEGYFQAPPVVPSELCKKLELALYVILEAGHHPLFLSVFDEYWQVLGSLSNVLSPILGKNYQLVGDYWIWCISPQTAVHGWGPHRDNQFRNRAVIRQDWLPTIATIWIPFTDAEPLNGCMYLLPTHLDPNFPNNLDYLHADRPQDIRALPAKAGSVLGWNQYILHWGGKASKWAKHPRISTGVYFQSSDVEPYVNKIIPFDKPLPLENRLAYIGANLELYAPKFLFPPEVRELCQRYMKAIW
jgi:hypothetical protein